MPLDPQQRQLVQNWFRAKCRLLGCPCCAGVQYDVTDVSSGPPVPMVGLVCTDCGTLRLFSAVAIGLLPPAP